MCFCGGAGNFDPVPAECCPVEVDGVTIVGDGLIAGTPLSVVPYSVPVAADGITITGDGTLGNPLVAVGTGAAIIVADEGLVLPGNPFTTLDFFGGGVTATNAGAGVAAITIPGTVTVDGVTITGDGSVGLPLAVIPSGLDEQVTVAVDGVTITGDGTTANPLVAVAGTAAILVEDEGVPVVGGPFTALDFVGEGVVASDGGGGTATVTIPRTVAVDGTTITGDGSTGNPLAVVVPFDPALIDFSVNSAAGDLIDARLVLRTGASANPTGAFNGGGTGNKAIVGYPLGLAGIPMGALLSVDYTWTNLLGLGGPFFNPPTAVTVITPYLNFLVDFGGGNLRVLVACNDQLNPLITAAIGTYSNPGGLNVLTYAWSSAQAVCIVGSPPAAVPGGVVPSVSVGVSFLENAYSWAALVAANPLARVIDAFPANPVLSPLGDGGMPVGALVAGIVIASGDSGNVIKSGKALSSWRVNGTELLV